MTTGQGGRAWAAAAVAVAAVLAATGCRTTGAARADGPPVSRVDFQEETVTGNPELARLNDEELFAKGQAAFAAEDYGSAAQAFGRIADLHPHSPHRVAALYNAGLAHQKLQQWEDAYARFSELSDPEHGQGERLDAAFGVAETLYFLDRDGDAAKVLQKLVARQDLPVGRAIQAQVQLGICQFEAGDPDTAELTLRRALERYQGLADRTEVSDYFPAQAEYFLGEVYRRYYEEVQLEPRKGVEKMSADLEEKARRLLSAQGHYLRSIRIGNHYWATAAGAQVGGLYESLYTHMAQSEDPPGLDAATAQAYRQELRTRIRVLLTKSIEAYESTLETAERIGAKTVFVDRTRESLAKVKQWLLADAEAGDAAAEPAAEEALPPPPAARTRRPGS